MPFRTWATKTDWDTAYDVGVELDGHPNTRPEVRLSYHRAVFIPWFRWAMPKLVAALNLQPSQRIALIGCGFGWGIEVLNEMGFANVVGTEPSAYIQANKASTEEADIDAKIVSVGLTPASGEGAVLKAKLFDGGTRSRAAANVLNEDLATTQSRRRLRDFFGTLDWIITEGVVESLTDAEAQTLSTRARQVTNAQIAHRITVPATAGTYNPKTTLAEWKAVLPNDICVGIPTWQVL